MEVKVLKEVGYEEALFGIGLSFGLTSGISLEEFIQNKPLFERLEGVARKLSHIGKRKGKDGKVSNISSGENKFLRQICVWLNINAPRFWWPEEDQYKISTTTQSESTIHSLVKKEFTIENFELDDDIEENDYIKDSIIPRLNMLRKQWIETNDDKYWRRLKRELPESFLQRRILTCNYANLQNMLQQRYRHKLKQWHFFCHEIASQVKHPELILPMKDGNFVDL